MSKIIFDAAIKQLSLFSGQKEPLKLARAISEITGIPLWSLQLLERKIAQQGNFKPLKKLLDDSRHTAAEKLKYRIGLKQASRQFSSDGVHYYNQLLVTVGTERGVIDICFNIIVECKKTDTGKMAQNVHIETRYKIYKGLRTSTFRQTLRVREPALAA